MEALPNQSATVFSDTLVSEKESVNKKKVYKWDINWSNTVILILLHLGALYGWWIRGEAKFQTEIFWKLFALIGSLGITGGAHRLWCHKTFKANRIAEFLFLIMASLTYQNSVYVWCRDHRVHHKYSETDADPHNAKRGFFFSHVGWLMVKKHADVREKGKSVDMSDLEVNPLVMFQHKYYYYIMFLLVLVFPTAVSYFLWGESLKLAFFRATIYKYITSVHLTWSINSLAHLYGNKPYNRNIGPVESYIPMIIAGGEGFHNYHHSFPWDYRASELSGDTRNITTYLIDFFAWCGWVTDRRKVPQDIIDARIARSGDGSRHEYKTIFNGVVTKAFEKRLVNTWNTSLLILCVYAV